MNALLFVLACGVHLAAVHGADPIVLDISNVSKTAFKIDELDKKQRRITANQGFAIGDVYDGETLVSQLPGPNVSSRYVTIERFREDECGIYGLVLKLDDNGQFNVVEIDTVYNDVPIRSRLVMDHTGTYVEFKGRYDELDICSEDFNAFVKRSQRLDSGIITTYRAKKCRYMGAIKCGDSVLLHRDNGIYSRYAEVLNHKWFIYTTPQVGESFKVEFIPAEWKDCRYRRVDEGSIYVDLSLDPIKKYGNILSGCGEDCIFFDGCSKADYRVVDLVDRHGVVYMGDKAKCIDVKLLTLENEKYVTVYARLVDGTHEAVLFKSVDDGPFLKHRPKAINMELTDFKIDKNITVTKRGNAKIYTIPSPNNMKWTIGAVTYEGKVLVGKVFLDSPNDVPYMVLSRRITVDGDFTTIETETDTNYPTNITYVTNSDGVWLYRPRPIQLNLANISSQNPNFRITQVGDTHYHITSSLERTKIGTIRLGPYIIRPNQYHALGTEVLFSRGSLLVTTQLADNKKFYSRFALSSGLLGEEARMFIEQQKEPVELKLQEIFTGNLPENFCTEKYGSFLRIYICKNIFMNTLGSVTFGDTIVSPYARFYELREVYVSTDFFLSSVIVKSYTSEGECVVEVFTSEVTNTDLQFFSVPKIPIDIDISDSFVPPEEISRIQDDRIFFYRVKPEHSIKYRIGNVMYKNKVLIEDTENVLARGINILTEPDAEKPEKYVIRVFDVSSDSRKSRLFVTDGVSGIANPAPKKPLPIDVSLEATRDVAIMVKQCQNIFSYYIPWTRACDYKLDEVLFTQGKDNTVVLISGEDMDVFPEIRLHKVGQYGNTLIAALSSEDAEPSYTKINIKDRRSQITVQDMDACEPDELFMDYYGYA